MTATKISNENNYLASYNRSFHIELAAWVDLLSETLRSTREWRCVSLASTVPFEWVTWPVLIYLVSGVTSEKSSVVWIFNQILSPFFKLMSLWILTVVEIAPDGAPDMRGSRSGVWAKIRLCTPEAAGVHYFIDREAPPSESLPTGLLALFISIVKIVNYLEIL